MGLTVGAMSDIGGLSGAEQRRRWRASALPALRGVVLDLGAGSGIAADHLAPDVAWWALEPARRLDPALPRRIGARPGARLLRAPAEEIPLADASVDAVIASTVLCSVREPAAVLAEVRRVLRPTGPLVFFEHVGAPQGSRTRRLQALYAPFSRAFDHGCDPRRDTERAIRDAGFSDVDVVRTEAPGLWGTVEPLIHGVALRP